MAARGNGRRERERDDSREAEERKAAERLMVLSSSLESGQSRLGLFYHT